MGTGRERQRGKQAPRGPPSPLTHRYEEEKEGKCECPHSWSQALLTQKSYDGLDQVDEAGAASRSTEEHVHRG